MQPITDPDVIEGYLVDASNTRGHAEALFRPRSAEDVAEVLAAARAAGAGVTVTARRTSTTGGPVPHGGWLLSTEHLDRIHAIDDCDGGVLLGEYQATVEASGRMFPPDPTSRHECSIGAAIACNASGARSFAYGPTRPWVEALEVVLPTGEIRWVDRSTAIPDTWPVPRWTEPGVKTAAGYYPADNLLDLMIGNEGTLGVITRARLNLTLSPEVMGLIAFFAERDPMLAFVERARAGARRPGQSATPDALVSTGHRVLRCPRAGPRPGTRSRHPADRVPCALRGGRARWRASPRSVVGCAGRTRRTRGPHHRDRGRCGSCPPARGAPRGTGWSERTGGRERHAQGGDGLRRSRRCPRRDDGCLRRSPAPSHLFRPYRRQPPASQPAAPDHRGTGRGTFPVPGPSPTGPSLWAAPSRQNTASGGSSADCSQTWWVPDVLDGFRALRTAVDPAGVSVGASCSERARGSRPMGMRVFPVTNRGASSGTV